MDEHDIRGLEAELRSDDYKGQNSAGEMNKKQKNTPAEASAAVPDEAKAFSRKGDFFAARGAETLSRELSEPKSKKVKNPRRIKRRKRKTKKKNQRKENRLRLRPHPHLPKHVRSLF